MAVLSPKLTLPIADYDRPWDGRIARARVLDWCKKKIAATPTTKEIDAECASNAFLLRRDGEPDYTREAWDLPYADVADGRLIIVPRGVKALASGHGVQAIQDVSEGDKERMRRYVCQLYDACRKKYTQMPACPFEKGSKVTRPISGGLMTAPAPEAPEAPTEENPLANPSDADKEIMAQVCELLAKLNIECPFEDMTDSAEPDSEHDPADDGLTAAGIADPAKTWDGSGAQGRIIAHCEGKGDSCWKQAYLVPGATPSDSKFPVMDVVGGELQIVPKALIAAAGRLGQAKGVDAGALKSKICGLYSQVQNKFPDFPDCPLADNKDKPEKKPNPMQEDDHVDASLGRPLNTGLDYSRTAAGIPVIGRKAPLKPPLEWFASPEYPLEAPMPLTISADGRVQGHGALWDSCHAGFADRCVPVPHSAQDYKFFHRGAVETDDNVLVAVGHLTVGGGHADEDGSLRAATEHYDNVGTTVAVVAAHEDRWGVYLAGSLTPEATPEQIAMLRRSPLSGDWRAFDGNLELVAMHGVNVPGFGVDRPRVAVAASGVLIFPGPPKAEPKREVVITMDEIESRISLAASALLKEK